MFMVQAASSIIYKTSSSSFYGSVLCRSDQDMATQAAMLLQTQISVCVLCVTPGSQEHDSPYGVLGSRAAAVSATARFAGQPGRRCGGGAVGAPEFLTEGLLDLVSPGAFPGRQLRGFHGWLAALPKDQKILQQWYGRGRATRVCVQRNGSRFIRRFVVWGYL